MTALQRQVFGAVPVGAADQPRVPRRLRPFPRPGHLLPAGNPTDRRWLAVERRSPANRPGLALQLCTLPWLGSRPGPADRGAGRRGGIASQTSWGWTWPCSPATAGAGTGLAPSTCGRSSTGWTGGQPRWSPAGAPFLLSSGRRHACPARTPPPRATRCGGEARRTARLTRWAGAVGRAGEKASPPRRGEARLGSSSRNVTTARYCAGPRHSAELRPDPTGPPVGYVSPPRVKRCPFGV